MTNGEICRGQGRFCLHALHAMHALESAKIGRFSVKSDVCMPSKFLEKWGRPRSLHAHDFQCSDAPDWFTNGQTFRHEVNSTRWTDNKFHRTNKLAASERAKDTEKKRQHELIKFDECSSQLHVFDQSVQYYCGVLYSQVSNCRSIEELRKTVPAVELSWIDQVVSQTSSKFLKIFKLDDSVGFLLQSFGRSENMTELVLVNTLNTRFINLVYTIYLLI